MIRGLFRGTVLEPGDADYTLACAGFNGETTRRPRLIVRCVDDGDVQAAVRLAVNEGLPLSVRGGGHSIGGYGSVDGGIVVDLRSRRRVSLDREDDAISVEGGCTWGEVIYHLTREHRATPGGFSARVGVGGLTLGGGYGLLSRLHGLAADNLVHADVVTSDGNMVRAGAGDADLLWAMRGAGANFGAVTSLRLRVHAVPPLLVAQAVYPLDQAGDLLRRYAELIPALPDATTVYLGLAGQPAGAGVLTFLGFHLGDRAEAERLLGPLARLGRPLVAQMQAAAYWRIHVPGPDNFLQEGHHHAWKAHFLASLDDDALGTIAEHALQARNQDLLIMIEHLGGAIGRVRPDAAAFPHRHASFGVVTAVKWRPPGAADDARAIQGSLHRALAPRSIGTYVNYVGSPHGPLEVEAAYGANLPRLRQLKRRFDPSNLFRSNVNILPAEACTPLPGAGPEPR